MRGAVELCGVECGDSEWSAAECGGVKWRGVRIGAAEWRDVEWSAVGRGDGPFSPAPTQVGVINLLESMRTFVYTLAGLYNIGRVIFKFYFVSP